MDVTMGASVEAKQDKQIAPSQPDEAFLCKASDLQFILPFYHPLRPLIHLVGDIDGALKFLALDPTNIALQTCRLGKPKPAPTSIRTLPVSSVDGNINSKMAEEGQQSSESTSTSPPLHEASVLVKTFANWVKYLHPQQTVQIVWQTNEIQLHANQTGMKTHLTLPFQDLLEDEQALDVPHIIYSASVMMHGVSFCRAIRQLDYMHDSLAFMVTANQLEMKSLPSSGKKGAKVCLSWQHKAGAMYDKTDFSFVTIYFLTTQASVQREVCGAYFSSLLSALEHDTDAIVQIHFQPDQPLCIQVHAKGHTTCTREPVGASEPIQRLEPNVESEMKSTVESEMESKVESTMEVELKFYIAPIDTSGGGDASDLPTGANTAASEIPLGRRIESPARQSTIGPLAAVIPLDANLPRANQLQKEENKIAKKRGPKPHAERKPNAERKPKGERKKREPKESIQKSGQESKKRNRVKDDASPRRRKSKSRSKSHSTSMSPRPHKQSSKQTNNSEKKAKKMQRRKKPSRSPTRSRSRSRSYSRSTSRSQSS